MRRLTTLALTAAAIAAPALALQNTQQAEQPAAPPAEQAAGAAAPAGTQLDAMVMTTPPMDGAPGSRDTAMVTAGTYMIDPGHTLVTFTVDHMGFSSFTGQFGNPEGTLTLDPANPGAASVEVSFPISEVSTTSPELDEHLQGEDFFDAANNPMGTFKSTEVVVQGDRAAIRGDLTLRGVTKSVVLQTAFYGAGENPMSKAKTIGFRATTTINRSDFGIDYGLPAVSDEVLLVIDAAFEMQGAASEG